RQFCGNGYTSVCASFAAANRGQILLDEIKKVSFTVEDTNPDLRFAFDGNSAALPFRVNLYEYANLPQQRNEFTKIGNINPWTETVGVTDADIPLSGTSPTCAEPCLACLYKFNYLDYSYVPGDLVIGAIFDVHYKGSGPYSCGELRGKDGAMYTEVFNFALQQINSGNTNVRLNGVTLGGLSFDGCSNPPRAAAIINRVHTGMEIKATGGSMERFSIKDLVSWLTYDSETTVNVASLVKNLDMTVVSPSATSVKLDDKQEFSTFFRTIPSDSVVVRGMAKFVQEMGWKFVITANAPDSASRESRDYFRELLAGYGICVVAAYEFETDGSMETVWRGIEDGDTQVVAVFADPERYAEDFLEAKMNSDNYIFVANRPWGGVDPRYYDKIVDSVSFALRSPTIAQFVTYLRTITPAASNNPWFSALYENLLACDLPGSFTDNPACTGSPIQSWRQDLRTLPTINAVYALAQAIHLTLVEKCGSNYNGLCSAFLNDNNVQSSIRANMDRLNFLDISAQMFEFFDREANRGFELLKYSSSGSAQLKGTLDRSGALTLSDKPGLERDYQGVKSQCLRACDECATNNANMLDFSMITGDFYIVGLFDVHKNGSDPFSCGDINDKHGLPLLEAFNFAIEYINNDQGMFSDNNKLPGIRLGGIALDTCQSPTRAANLVANIQSGNLVLTKDGNTVQPQRIEAYVGPMDTESTLRVADVLNQLAIPQISYGAKGVELLDMDKYKYFLRSVPADDKQARAVISFLKKFEYNNIQLVTSFDEIGEPGREEFKNLALVNKICVKIEYVAGERGDMAGDAKRIVQELAKEGTAKVVILWMKDPLPLLLEANVNPSVNNGFMFIATDKWGANPEILTNPGLQNLLTNRELVILDVETADIPKFDEYLEPKTPDNYIRNPWFKEFHEHFKQCVWGDATVPGACDKASTIPRAENYVQDPYVLYVINAVFSVAEGIDRALKDLCTVDNVYQRGACNRYVTSGERRQKVMSGIKQVNFTDDTHQPFFYLENGQSDRGFHIYNVTGVDGSPNSFQYQNV
ncbi:hypothetical protein EGW08_008684, partial [Elysia chlorotica]